MKETSKRLLLIDANSIIHRAYHALPKLATPEGEVINAVYGFLLVFFRAIKELEPDYVVAAFDFPAPNFRHKIFKEYKAKRPPAPEELYSQMPKVKTILSTFNVPIFEKEGFEADDIIGTIVKVAKHKQAFPKIETIIVSGDKDVLQLVDDKVKVYLLKRGVKHIVIYDKEMVRDLFGGLEPAQLLDFKALRGDPSDNIPGVTGIGEKTAIDLLLNFKTLENLYAVLEGESCELKQTLKEKLIQYKDQALISRELAAINSSVDLPFSLESSKWPHYERDIVRQKLKEMEFYSLIDKLPFGEK